MRAVNQYNKAGMKAPTLPPHCITGTQEEEEEVRGIPLLRNQDFQIMTRC
jgi:hypothetical protein